MGKVLRSNFLEMGLASFLFLWMVTIGFVLVATPRGYACEIDNKLDAAAEGILTDEQLAGTNEATKSMSCKLLVPGPHLKVSSRRAPTSADIERANKIREETRQVLAKYQDYRVALQDGYEIRRPNLPQKRYHFSNATNSHANNNPNRSFDPARPSALLYEKENGNYKLIGVMYTASRGFSEADLNRRFPISVAPWHLHTNLCTPPKDQIQQRRRPDRRFGFSGSISTWQECTAAGGTFTSVEGNWMTHVDLYDSYEKD
jgi:hypothetical protein